MKAIKIVGIVLLLIIAAGFLLIYSLPNAAHMERTIIIKAEPSKVYQELVTFRNFNKWSPWAAKDKEASYTYSGPEFGEGAKISWASENPDVGHASMEILLADKNRRVVSRMLFDGYESSPRASMVLREVDDGTQVTWTYDEEDIEGLSKIFMLGIDGFLGGDFEKGLLALKDRVEALPDFDYQIDLEYVRAFDYIGVKDSSLIEPGMIATKMAEGFGEVTSYMNTRMIMPSGPRMAVFLTEGDFDVTFVCGIPVSGVDSLENDALQLYHQDSTLVLVGHYAGSYDQLTEVHEQIKRFASFYQYQITDKAWESYLTDAIEYPDTSLWKTNIYYPVK